MRTESNSVNPSNLKIPAKLGRELVEACKWLSRCQFPYRRLNNAFFEGWEKHLQAVDEQENVLVPLSDARQMSLALSSSSVLQWGASEVEGEQKRFTIAFNDLEDLFTNQAIQQKGGVS